MYVPKAAIDKTDESSISSVISEYKSLDYSSRGNYERLCGRYRDAIYAKEARLADELYKIMQAVQKNKGRKRGLRALPARRAFWEYIKGIGRKRIFSADDISRRLNISQDEAISMIEEATRHRLIHKDGPTTYRMHNIKKISNNSIRAYLNYGKPTTSESNQIVSRSKNEHQRKFEKNYAKLLEASGKSSSEIQRSIDNVNKASESLAVRRKGNEIAKKRNSAKKIDWGKDARKMQNTQRRTKYRTINGGRSIKKEFMDPDEKDKTKRRKLHLGETRRFMDFYGLDG